MICAQKLLKKVSAVADKPDDTSHETKNQLSPFIRYDRTRTCDRRTDRQTDRHWATATTALAQRRTGKTCHYMHRHVARKKSNNKRLYGRCIKLYFHCHQLTIISCPTFRVLCLR